MLIRAVTVCGRITAIACLASRLLALDDDLICSDNDNSYSGYYAFTYTNWYVERLYGVYEAQPGDGCYDIAAEYGVTLDEVYAWNPAVGDDCSGLWPDYYYCVGM